MKARRSTVSAFLRSAVLLAMLIPIGSLHPPVAHARSVAPSATVPNSSHISDAPNATPLMFIENVGQFDSDVRFQLPGGDRTIWLADDAIWVPLAGQPAAPFARQAPTGTTTGTTDAWADLLRATCLGGGGWDEGRGMPAGLADPGGLLPFSGHRRAADFGTDAGRRLAVMNLDTFE